MAALDEIFIGLLTVAIFAVILGSPYGPRSIDAAGKMIADLAGVINK